MANYSFDCTGANSALRTLAMNLVAGNKVDSRNGPTRELTHVDVRIAHPLAREILLPSRKANLAAQVAETAWVLAGRNDIEWLSHYLPRAKDFSDNGTTWRAGYGPRLRRYPDAYQGVGEPIDQLAAVIGLLQQDRNTRRAVISLWDPSEDTLPGKDIACNNWLQFSIRDGYLDMHVVARSNDLIWGWSGINQFEWSVLQEIIAAAVGAHVGVAHYTIASLHAYTDRHLEKLQKLSTENCDQGVEHNGVRFKFQAPSVMEPIEELDEILTRFFEIEEKIRTEGAEAADEDVTNFPEPMFQSWLQVLQWWWSADLKWLGSEVTPSGHNKGQALYQAALVSMQPPAGRRVELGSPFIKAVTKLHDEKHEAYGDSWKKRGELFSILPNIARKVDRLGGAETADETSADTAIDLMVYLAKYQTWLEDGRNSDNPAEANLILRGVDRRLLPEREWEQNMGAHRDTDTQQRIDFIRDRFERLLKDAEDDRRNVAHRTGLVKDMLPQAYILARRLWLAEQPIDDEDLDFL